MRKIRGVQAAAHLEMIIAFILFTGFITFLFTTIKPYNEELLPETTIQGIYNKLTEETKTEYETVSIKLQNTPTNCILITLNKELFKQDITAVKAFDLQGTNIKAQYDENTTQLHLASTNTFHQLTFSPAYNNHEDNNYTCNENKTENYQLGGINKRNILSKEKIKKLEEQYYNNYEETKKTLGIPPIYDFNIEATKINISMKKETPETGNILAKEYLTETLEPKTGKIQNTRINIQLW